MKRHWVVAGKPDKTVRNQSVSGDVTGIQDGGVYRGAVWGCRTSDSLPFPALFLEQVGVGAGSYKDNSAALARRVVHFIDQQEIATDMAFAVSGPLALERMVEPFGAERCVIGDQQQHRLLEAIEIIAP